MKWFAAIVFVFFFAGVKAQGQASESQLALSYFKDKEFDKAAILYEKLYTSTTSRVYFTYYIQCLIELKNYEEAEKIIKKEAKKNKYDPGFLVELGSLYKQQGRITDATEEYEEAIKKMSPGQANVINLANSFISHREYDFAEKVYLEGRKQQKGIYGFYFELAYLYQIQRNYPRMIEEYLDLLDVQENYIQAVQNRLQATVYSERDGQLTEMLKTELIRRIQKSSSKTIFSELLIWIYFQENDYKNALLQSVALDKRNKEDGKRIYDLGVLAAGHRDYESALKSFQYLIDKGESSAFYIEARSEYLNTLFDKITRSNSFTKQEIVTLDNQFAEAIRELGYNPSTFYIMMKRAHIQAFFLDDASRAVELLDSALLIPRLSQRQISEGKLELGNVFLYSGDFWNATIYFAQVEKLNPNEPIGHEAKFNKAKLAYFSGDFQWAQAQLDVLKAATSKLIANDAFELSLRISDNLAYDSTGTSLQQFARADMLKFRHRDSLALLTLDSVVKDPAAYALHDDAYFSKAMIYRSHGDYEKAIQCLDTVLVSFSFDILADNALFYMADIYEFDLHDYEKAKELYSKLILDYSDSIFMIESRKRFRKLRGDFDDTDNVEERFFLGLPN